MLELLLDMFVALMWDMFILLLIVLMVLAMIVTFFEIISRVVKQLWEA